MRRFPSLLGLLTALGSVPSMGQASGPGGVEVGDIDRQADPCTDFFQYANGKWRAENPIPPDMKRWSRRWRAGEEAKEQLRQILDEISKRTDWPRGSAEQLVSDFYGSCMDEAAIESLGISPARPTLAQIDAIANLADLQRTIRLLLSMGIPAPFGLVSQPDQHDPAQTVANVLASGLGLPDRDYYLKPDRRFVEARERYRLHVARVFKLAGYGEDRARSASRTVFEFEKQLAQASLDNVALRDPHNTDHKGTFDALTRMAPSIDWVSLFAEGRMPRVDLNVAEPRFLAQLEKQLHGRSLQDWRTYLKWQLLNASADWLSSAFVNENFAFNGRFLGGATELKPRWKRCAEATDQLLGDALGKKYVERFFPPAAKARADEMVKNILSAMRDTIEGLQWMGPDTKTRALEKLSTFNPKIGYPDRWKDYAGLEIHRGSYWDNELAASRWNVSDERARVGKPTDRALWGMTPPTSNAYYNPLLNEIVFPAGILQRPSFGVDEADAINYGGIGVVIGHEISHGFDDEGAQYDARGRLENWWTADDLARFRDRTACVARQFDGYFVEPGIHHNGRLVLGESIADLAGVKLAHLALQKAKKAHPQPTIDGFTPDQQFFIAWGQWRGDEIRPEEQRQMVQVDPHPIGKYRVIGPLSNLPAFASVFACRAGSPMVRPPVERCEVW